MTTNRLERITWVARRSARAARTGYASVIHTKEYLCSKAAEMTNPHYNQAEAAKERKERYDLRAGNIRKFYMPALR